jgi:hypothetical protein
MAISYFLYVTNRLLLAATIRESFFFDVSILYAYSVICYKSENGLNIHGLNGVYVRFVSRWAVGVIGVALWAK